VQILLKLGPYNGQHMHSVDCMCGIVLNCQELNCRACDNLGFSVMAAAAVLVGPAGPRSSSAAAGGTGARSSAGAPAG